MGVRFDLRLKGSDAYQRQLKTVSDLASGKDIRLRKVMGAQMLLATQRTFRAQKDPVTDQPWKPTTDFTLQSRTGGGGGGKTLSDDRLLAGSLQSFKLRGRKTIRQFTNRPGARLHQLGGTITPKGAKSLAIPITKQARRRRPRSFIPELQARGIPVSDHYVFAKKAVIPRRRFLGLNKKKLDKIARITELKWAEFVGKVT